MNSSITFLGLAEKAGKLTIGEDSCGMAARAKKVKLILTAFDASQNSLTRAGYYAQDAKAPIIHLPYTKNELGAVLGRGTPGMIAITDIGFASAFAKKLSLEVPGLCDKEAEALSISNDKAAERRKEALRHKKNLKTGKKHKI